MCTPSGSSPAASRTPTSACQSPAAAKQLPQASQSYPPVQPEFDCNPTVGLIMIQKKPMVAACLGSTRQCVLCGQIRARLRIASMQGHCRGCAKSLQPRGRQMTAPHRCQAAPRLQPRLQSSSNILMSKEHCSAKVMLLCCAWLKWPGSCQQVARQRTLLFRPAMAMGGGSQSSLMSSCLVDK